MEIKLGFPRPPPPPKTKESGPLFARGLAKDCEDLRHGRRGSGEGGRRGARFWDLLGLCGQKVLASEERMGNEPADHKRREVLVSEAGISG